MKVERVLDLLFFSHSSNTHKFALNDSLIKLYMYHNRSLICIHVDAFSQMFSSHTAAVNINLASTSSVLYFTNYTEGDGDGPISIA